MADGFDINTLLGLQPDPSQYGQMPAAAFFDPSMMGGYTPQTKSGADSFARQLQQQQFAAQQAQQAQQDKLLALQFDAQQKQQLQQALFGQQQLQSQGPYAPAVSALTKDINDYATTQNPLFQFGAALMPAAQELTQGSNPWLAALARGLAGGAGQGLERYAYNDAINETRPVLQKFFAMASDPQAGQKMMNDPQLSAYAMPFVLQQLGEAAKRKDLALAAQGDWMKQGLQVGADGTVSPVPGYAQSMAGTQGLEQRAKADAQNASDQTYDPVTEALKAQAQGKGLSPALLAQLKGTPYEGVQTVDDMKLISDALKASKLDKISQKNIVDTNQKIQLAKQLNDIMEQVDTTQPYLGPIAALNPNSKTAIYERNLIPLADEIAKAMAGRSNSQIIQQNLEAMKPKLGQSAESLKASIGQVRDWILQHASDDMKALPPTGGTNLQQIFQQAAMGGGTENFGQQPQMQPSASPAPTPTPGGSPMVTIRNKNTGQIVQVPASMLGGG